MTAGGVDPDQSGLTSRVVKVLEQVIEAAEPVGPRGLARRTGIDRSAVGRILQQLRDLGVLEQTPGGYLPGPRLFTMGRALAALDTLPNAAGPILQRLVDLFDETCYVCVLHRDAAVYLYEVQSSHPVRFVVELGKPVPLHAGAAGRAIVAGLTAEAAARLLGEGPLPALTANTVRDVAEVLELAEEDRARGYSVSIAERVEGGASVAAPFFDHTGGCRGSVVFTAPLTRLDRARIDEIGAAVSGAAERLSGRLGHIGG